MLIICQKLKSGTLYGQTNCTSDNIKYDTHKLFVHLSFNTIINHGFTPNGMLLTNIQPIVKNKQTLVNSSDNYRAILLSSIIGKLLDSRSSHYIRLPVWL